MTIWFSPKVLQFVPPVALFFVFVFQFFPWTGVYPGGYAAATQNAWTVAFPFWVSDDPNVDQKVFHFTTEQELKDNKDKNEKDKERGADRPGMGLLALFYLFCFFPVFALTVVCAALGVVLLKLPPALAPILPWRWGIVFVLNLVVLFILGLQLLAGFPLEGNMKSYGEWKAGREIKETKRNTVQETNYRIIVGQTAGMAERTT